MKKIEIRMPEWLEELIGEKCEPWEAEYTTLENGPARLIFLGESCNKNLMVVDMRNAGFGDPSYYISSPSEGIAIESISTLTESKWIINRLMRRGMDAFDATTSAAVLADHGNF